MKYLIRYNENVGTDILEYITSCFVDLSIKKIDYMHDLDNIIILYINYPKNINSTHQNIKKLIDYQREIIELFESVENALDKIKILYNFKYSLVNDSLSKHLKIVMRDFTAK